MNKAELVEAVAEKAELSKRDAEAAVDAVLEVIEAAVVKGEEVKLSGFGIFSKKARAIQPEEDQDPSFQHRRFQGLQSLQRETQLRISNDI